MSTFQQKLLEKYKEIDLQHTHRGENQVANRNSFGAQ